MSYVQKETLLELRLNNTEKMLQILWVCLQDLQPPSVQEGIGNAIGKYFDANVELGADFTSTEFLTLNNKG